MTENSSINQQTRLALSLAALGVVYGDIGTSPLYAFRESLNGLPCNLTNILGLLSLIFWSLIFSVSIKYLWVVFRADNNGEGGILALLTLLRRSTGHQLKKALLILGIFGAGLMIGDGMLTPAISVISAIEGFEVIAPAFAHWILPIAFIILIILFAIQSVGTARIGFMFGPVIFVWFVTIALLGILQIINNPIVLQAINPFYAFDFLSINGWKGYSLLGSVFLVMTGAEALYADLGHFTKQSIRLSWFLVALPGVMLNYLGQGAYLLEHPAAVNNPFYAIAPEWFSIPLLFIATLATVIASQAVISATFSLMKQAISLGLCPPLSIIQCSESQRGQIYIPQVNVLLALGTLILVATFKNSNALAHAYGIAVNLVMIITTILLIYLARRKWQWSLIKVFSIFTFLVVIDLAFLGANFQKVYTGGWVPIVLALLFAVIMYTWYKGMQYLRKEYAKGKDISEALTYFNKKRTKRIPDITAVFITDPYEQSGINFFHFLKLSHVMPENILIINSKVEGIPYVPLSDRFACKYLGKNIYQLTLSYGFMETISIPKALSQANEAEVLPFIIKTEAALYLVEILNIVASQKKQTLWFFWQEKLFSYLWRNCSINLNIDFYRLPYDRTIAIGTYCII